MTFESANAENITTELKFETRLEYQTHGTSNTLD